MRTIFLSRGPTSPCGESTPSSPITTATTTPPTPYVPDPDVQRRDVPQLLNDVNTIVLHDKGQSMILRALLRRLIHRIQSLELRLDKQERETLHPWSRNYLPQQHQKLHQKRFRVTQTNTTICTQHKKTKMISRTPALRASDLGLTFTIGTSPPIRSVRCDTCGQSQSARDLHTSETGVQNCRTCDKVHARESFFSLEDDYGDEGSDSGVFF